MRPPYARECRFKRPTLLLDERGRKDEREGERECVFERERERDRERKR